MAGGDKAASGTLQMQALAEWRLDGEPGQAEAFDNAADVYRPHSRIGHLLSSRESPGLCTVVQVVRTHSDGFIGSGFSFCLVVPF